jgi:hypothetical protein
VRGCRLRGFFNVGQCFLTARAGVFLRQGTTGVNTTHADKPGHLTAEWFGAQTLLQASIATAFASFRT